jgi:hypothetical protein
MRSRHLWLIGLVGLVLVALIAWPGRAQNARPDDKSVDARLDRIEKQLASIQEHLTRLEKPTGWQRVKETTTTSIFMNSETGKVKFIYTDGTDRVTEK